MKRFSRNGISLCKKCPLRDRPRVWSEYPSDGTPQLAVIGESPGAEEEAEKRPFVGPAGRLLNHVLHEAEINRHRLWVANLISCRPPENDLASFEGQEALRLCRPGLDAELASMKKSGIKLIVPLGTKPSQALGVPETITRSRGSVYQIGGRILLPTFHPSFILRGARKEEGTWIGDFIKARDIAKNGWKPPLEKFDLFPSLSSLQIFVNLALKSKSPVAVDIETTGLSPDSGRIVVIGLGLPERVVCIPLLKKTGLAYWAPSEYNGVLSLLHRLFREKELVFQNAPFDISWLMKNGFTIGKTPHDVLLMHHTLHPELPHNLGYIVSVYGTTPFWKGEMLDREETILQIEDETLRRYNARDVAVLHEVLPGLLADLDELKLRHIYEEIARKMVLPVVEMNLTGLLVDKKALEKWKRSLAQRYSHLNYKIHEICSLHEAFSLASDEDLRLLIYGIKAPKFARAEEEMRRYEENPKLRRDTKKYKALNDLASVAESTHPLYAPRSTVRSTDSGKASVAAESLLARKIACNNRLSAIKGLKQKDATIERREVEKAILLFTLLDEFNEVDKLRSTYTRFPVWQDGRCHPSYLVHGTKTGRLSSKGPNAQNIPEDARHIFIAKPGCVLVGPDYSNLELRVIANESGDKPMLKTFSKGGSVHDENTKDLFGINEKSKLWKIARAAQKTYIFGKKCYGGTLRGIYEKVVNKAPELELTFADFSRADARFDQKHPDLAAWCIKQANLGLTERRVTNAFGRVRILLGDDSEVEREALNTPIQGTAADIANLALIGIYTEIHQKKMQARLVGQVHDQILIECPRTELTQIKRIMRKHMEMTHHLWDRDVSFPIEMKIGSNWGDLKETK
jgi:uracil-DNA glycosylase family 4